MLYTDTVNKKKKIEKEKINKKESGHEGRERARDKRGGGKRNRAQKRHGLTVTDNRQTNRRTSSDRERETKKARHQNNTT